MKKIEVSSIAPGTIADGNYYTESGELLLSKGVSISQDHINIMLKRNIFDIFLKNFEEDDEVNAILSKKIDVLEELSVNETSVADLPDSFSTMHHALNHPELMAIQSGEQGALHLNKSKKSLELDSRLNDGFDREKPHGPALLKKARQLFVAQRTDTYKKEIALSHNEAISHIKTVLNALADAQYMEETTIRSIVNLFIKTYLTDRSILLNIATIRPSDGDYLYHHVLNVCILAINIAAAAKYNEQQVCEIGMGALLHDVGMLLVPEEIRFKKGRLSKDEWFEVQKHSILGIHILEKISHLPESALLVTYQNHERGNGKGYPKQRSDRFIHPFAKIVQVADVYESLCSPRDYRPPYLPYRAMELLIKMSAKNLLSVEYVKAFMTYASLFPIGSIVELSNHSIGRVIQANEQHQTKPIVSVIIDPDGAFLNQEKIYQIVLFKEPSMQIIRAIEPSNLPSFDIMHGF
jgi:HD-GYP domain-containing protein (c-di-GMP phosphodiesterase class II)